MLLAGVGFVGLAGHLARMLHGAAPDGVAAGERDWWMLAPLAVSLRRHDRPRPPSAGRRRTAPRPHRGGLVDMSDMHARAADIGAQLGDRLSAADAGPRPGAARARASTADMPAVAGLLQRRRRRPRPDGRRRSASTTRAASRSTTCSTTSRTTGSPTSRRMSRLEARAWSSLAQQSYPASRFEREIRDLFGHHACRSPRPAAARAARVLARGLLSAPAGRAAPELRATMGGRSRSDRSRGRACTRFRSAPCMRASSSPATSASARSARRSST